MAVHKGCALVGECQAIPARCARRWHRSGASHDGANRRKAHAPEFPRMGEAAGKEPWPVGTLRLMVQSKAGTRPDGLQKDLAEPRNRATHDGAALNAAKANAAIA